MWRRCRGCCEASNAGQAGVALAERRHEEELEAAEWHAEALGRCATSPKITNRLLSEDTCRKLSATADTDRRRRQGVKRTACIAGIVLTGLTGCSEQGAATCTLYRNSPFGIARIHWATFDANESDPSYNLNNCMMAARVLNANVTASAKNAGQERDPSLGFWCEPGPFETDGPIPTSFQEAFPTDI